jgi:hypothetical protein
MEHSSEHGSGIAYAQASVWSIAVSMTAASRIRIHGSGARSGIAPIPSSL